MGHALAEEVAQHDTRFLVPVTVLPDFVQTLYRGVDDVSAVLRWREQPYRCAVSIIRLIKGKWRGLNEGGYKTAVLMLTT